VIPGKIVRFLEQYANVAFARTRDRVPAGHRVSGWRVGADHRTVAALVPELFAARLIESLLDNGQLAVTIEEFPSHETYQFKGRYVRHRPVEPDDLVVVDRIRARFVKSLKPVQPDAPDDVLRAYIAPPSLAVEFEVHEVFRQTPGPGAGTRLSPPREP